MAQKNGPFALPLFVSSSLCLFDSLSLCLLVEKFRQKTNNFEPFFSDSTLTFLTYRNTFRLPILPSRRAVLLCLPLIKIRGRQIKIRGRQILPGCASKTPILKGKWRKKGGAEAPPISLYKYNTFHRQKQEVLKPKKGVGCGKFWRRCVIIANLLRCYRIRAWSCTSVHSLRPHPQRLAS